MKEQTWWALEYGSGSNTEFILNADCDGIAAFTTKRRALEEIRGLDMIGVPIAPVRVKLVKVEKAIEAYMKAAKPGDDSPLMPELGPRPTGPDSYEFLPEELKSHDAAIRKAEQQRCAGIVGDVLRDMYFSVNLIAEAKQRILDGAEAEKAGYVHVEGTPVPPPYKTTTAEWPGLPGVAIKTHPNTRGDFRFTQADLDAAVKAEREKERERAVSKVESRWPLGGWNDSARLHITTAILIDRKGVEDVVSPDNLPLISRNELNAAIQRTRENAVAWVRAWWDSVEAVKYNKAPLSCMAPSDLFQHILAGDEAPGQGGKE